jgi:8-oxo-dGTP diphosphatase
MKRGEDFIGVGVVYYCHDGHGRYVFSKRGKNCRDEQGTWDPGGGGVELGDTVEQTLKKEIAEEYGTDVISHEFLGYRDVHRVNDGKKTHWIGLDFKVLIDPKKVRNAEPHKFDAVEWFTLDNLPTPLHSQVAAELEKYRGRF